MVKKVTTAEFHDLITNSQIPVVLDFWAEWCPPCRAFASVIDAFAEEYDGKVVVGKVNTDEEEALKQQFHIMSIPTVLIFKNGELTETLLGSRSLDELADAVDVHLN